MGTGGTQLDRETHPSALRSWPLALRAGWGFQSERKERGVKHSCLGTKPSAPLSITRVSPGILWLLAPSTIKRDDLLPAYSGFTHRAFLPVWPCLQPLGRKYEVFSSTKRVSKLLEPPCLPVHLMNTYLMETGPTGFKKKKKKARVKLQERAADPRTWKLMASPPRYCCYNTIYLS